jgi:hypothetical protein
MAAAPAAAAPGPKGGAAPLYFPTAVGATAVYQTTIGKLKYEHTHRVTQVVQEPDGVRVTVERAELGDAPLEYEMVVSPAGLSHTKTSGQALDPPVPLLRPPAKVGGTWEWDRPGARSRYMLAGEEEVQVPGGKFKAVRIDVERVDGKAMRQSAVWYAPGVGVVKQVFYNPGRDDQVQELKSFTPGGK